MGFEYDLGRGRGPQGIAGPVGPQGPAGATGATPRISIGEVITLPADADATVQLRSGSLPDAPVLDFGLPRGKSSGDMAAMVYDPNNKHQDMFAYVDARSGRRCSTVVVAAADSMDTMRADYRCDGSADQYTIQQAINAVENGGIVQLLEGHYHLDSSGIEVDEYGDTVLLRIMGKNIELRGCGPATVLRLADAALSSGSCYLLSAEAEQLRLSELSIDGNSDNNSGADIYGVYSSVMAANFSADHIVIENCAAQGLIWSGAYAHISHCRVGSCGDAVMLGGHYAQMESCVLSGNNYAVRVQGAKVNLQDNIISNKAAAGIYMQGASGVVNSNMLFGQPVGISLTSCTDVMLTENYVRRFVGDGSYADNEYSVLLTDCVEILAVGNWLRGKALSAVGNCSSVQLSYSDSDWNCTM